MNNEILNWARRHGVSREAIQDLQRIWLGVNDSPLLDPKSQQPGSEAFVQSKVRLDASSMGGRLWRNNVGALMDSRGVPVRYGLCNESKEVNAVCKSSDLIGIQPIVITHSMVGTTIGQFVARECKKADWRPGERAKDESAQANFINLVNALGGDAKFTNGTY
jgi:hypothetical protein